jgi:hypothetical protein
VAPTGAACYLRAAPLSLPSKGPCLRPDVSPKRYTFQARWLFGRGRARVDHFDQRLYLALSAPLRFVILHAPRSFARARIAKLFPFSELSARKMDFGSAEIVFANEAKLEQNFVTGAGCIFYFRFDPGFFGNARAAAV